MAYSSMMNKELRSSVKRRSETGGIRHHGKYSRKSGAPSRGAEKTGTEGCRAIRAVY